MECIIVGGVVVAFIGWGLLRWADNREEWRATITHVDERTVPGRGQDEIGRYIHYKRDDGREGVITVVDDDPDLRGARVGQKLLKPRGESTPRLVR